MARSYRLETHVLCRHTRRFPVKSPEIPVNEPNTSAGLRRHGRGAAPRRGRRHESDLYGDRVRRRDRDARRSLRPGIRRPSRNVAGGARRAGTVGPGQRTDDGVQLLPDGDADLPAQARPRSPAGSVDRHRPPHRGVVSRIRDQNSPAGHGQADRGWPDGAAHRAPRPSALLHQHRRRPRGRQLERAAPAPRRTTGAAAGSCRHHRGAGCRRQRSALRRPRRVGALGTPVDR